MTDLLTIWDQINGDFEQIGEADIRRVQRNLTKVKPNEHPLGAIHNEALKKLWALADRYDGLSKQGLVDALHRAETDAEASECRQNAARYAALEEVVRDLFWIQAKDDIGAWEHTGDIGVKADWMLVCGVSPEKGLAALIGGLMRPGPEQ